MNQGMILGEMEYVGYKHKGEWRSAVKDIPADWETIRLQEEQVEAFSDIHTCGHIVLAGFKKDSAR